MGQLRKIDHIVVLMLENRSFDCLLGKLYPKSDSFEGLSGGEQNPDANGSPETSPVPTKRRCGFPIRIPASCGLTSTPNYSAAPARLLPAKRRP